MIMAVIKILPHHVMHYFEIYFLKRNPERFSWYDNEIAKLNGEETLKLVVSNPSQLVQIVSSYDAFCKMCPRNKRGDNYVQQEGTCDTYENSNFSNDLDLAKTLRIDDLIDQEPITAEALFNKLEPVYKRIFTEKPDPCSKKLTPRELFRVSENELLTNPTLAQ